MEARTITTNLTAKLLILNPGDYDLWLIKIEQYFLMTDYSLWEVIKSGNKVLKRTVGIVKQEYEPTIAEEKLDRRNEMKARGTLLMALPNKETSSSETLDQSFDKFQKLISQLEIQGEVIGKEDMNLKLLRSSSSTSQNPQNIAFVSFNTLSNTTKIDNTAKGVSAAHTQVNTVNSTIVNNLSDAVICAFLASQPHFPQLARGDLEQIDHDDLKEMDLHWKMAMLTIRARRFIKRTGKNLDMNSQRIGFDRSKVECFNYHKHGHFVRECRAPKNQEYKGRDYGSSSSLDSKVDSCLKSCVKAYTTLKEQYDNLSSDYKKSQFNLISYKAGNFMPPKPDLMFLDEHVESEFIDVVSNVTTGKVNTVKSNQETTDKGKITTASASVNTTVRQINTADPKTTVNHPRLKLNAFKRGYSHKTRSFNRPQHAGFGKPSLVVHQLLLRNTLTLMHEDNPQQKEYKEKGVINSGCSRNIIGNKSYLTEYEDYDGGLVSFGFGKGRISSKVLLRVPRKDNIYSIDLKSVVPTRGLTYLFAKATIEESNLWYRRLGHINFKIMNKLVRGNLIKGLPLKVFENDHSCVAYKKGKQHKASYKTKLVNSISKPLHMLHMDLFGPINVKSLMKKSYCLVVTDDFNRFSWVFFLATKDETSGILKTFITGLENQLDFKVKVIRCDNGTEFKNSVMNQFCDMKGIKREFSVARTPQQNGAEAVNTACYVLNRALVIKLHNKTPYELIRGRPLLIDFMKPFGCPVTILNTRDNLGKFDEKVDEGFFVGYSINIKAMRVFKKRTKTVEETLNIRFLENAPNVKGNGLDWLFDVDSLIISMNYVPVIARDQTNNNAGTKDNIVAGSKDSDDDARVKPTEVDESRSSDNGGKDAQNPRSESGRIVQEEGQIKHTNSTNNLNTVSTPISTAGSSFDYDDLSSPVNTAGPSIITANELKEQLFQQFSPFKNAFTLP
ncbi:putative ribonuclease H-like domain-containing protein [Tanacetum coccineum]